MRPSGSTTPIIFGFILAIGITLTLPYFAFGAARSFRSSGKFRAPMMHRQHLVHRQHFFSPLSTGLDSTGLDFWVGVESSTSSQSSLFSSFNLQQPPNLVNLAKTEFTFSRVGWTAGMEWKSYSPDTGPMRSKRKSVDPLI